MIAKVLGLLRVNGRTATRVGRRDGGRSSNAASVEVLLSLRLVALGRGPLFARSMC